MQDKKSLDDVFTPIQFKLTYQIISKASNNLFCSQCPLDYKKENVTKEVNAIPYYTFLQIF